MGSDTLAATLEMFGESGGFSLRRRRRPKKHIATMARIMPAVRPQIKPTATAAAGKGLEW